MSDIFTTLKRLRRLPIEHRIAHLRALICAEKPRSIRRKDLEAALRHEITAQLRKECRAA